MYRYSHTSIGHILVYLIDLPPCSVDRYNVDMDRYWYDNLVDYSYLIINNVQSYIHLWSIWLICHHIQWVDSMQIWIDTGPVWQSGWLVTWSLIMHSYGHTSTWTVWSIWLIYHNVDRYWYHSVVSWLVSWLAIVVKIGQNCGQEVKAIIRIIRQSHVWMEQTTTTEVEGKRSGSIIP